MLQSVWEARASRLDEARQTLRVFVEEVSCRHRRHDEDAVGESHHRHPWADETGLIKDACLVDGAATANPCCHREAHPTLGPFRQARRAPALVLRLPQRDTQAHRLPRPLRPRRDAHG